MRVCVRARARAFMNFDALMGNTAVTLDITLRVQIIVRDISKKHFCLIFREKQSDSDCFTLQIKIVILRNFKNYLPSDTASCLTELKASSNTAVTALLCPTSLKTFFNTSVFRRVRENFENYY